MNQYSVAGAGLKKMFIAEVGALVCTVLALIPIIGKIAGIGSFVFLIIGLVGLYGAGQQIDGCKKAFTLQIAVLVGSILLSILGAVLVVAAPAVGVIFIAALGIAVAVVSFLAIYYICTSVSEVMTKVGDADAAKTGETAWKVMLACKIVSIVATLLAFVPLLSDMIDIASAIVGVVGSAFYIIFLNKSSNRLAA